MIIYKGRAKCSCGKMAKFESRHRHSAAMSEYACSDHAYRIKDFGDPVVDDGHMSLADEMTWGRL